MPWSNSRPGSDPKYATREHRELRARFVEAINAGEIVLCSETECLFPTRQIVETDGRPPHGLTLAHADDGVTYKGASHRLCNLRDGSKRGNQRSRASRIHW